LRKNLIRKRSAVSFQLSAFPVASGRIDFHQHLPPEGSAES
jgi:hypothetical protein